MYVIDVYCTKCEMTQLTITLPGENLDHVLNSQYRCPNCNSITEKYFRGRAKRTSY